MQKSGYYTKQVKNCNYSCTLNKSTNIDFGYRDLSNKGFISKLKMKSFDINPRNRRKCIVNAKHSKLRFLMPI